MVYSFGKLSPTIHPLCSNKGDSSPKSYKNRVQTIPRCALWGYLVEYVPKAYHFGPPFPWCDSLVISWPFSRRLHIWNSNYHPCIQSWHIHIDELDGHLWGQLQGGTKMPLSPPTPRARWWQGPHASSFFARETSGYEGRPPCCPSQATRKTGKGEASPHIQQSSLAGELRWLL